MSLGYDDMYQVHYGTTHGRDSEREALIVSFLARAFILVPKVIPTSHKVHVVVFETDRIVHSS